MGVRWVLVGVVWVLLGLGCCVGLLSGGCLVEVVEWELYVKWWWFGGGGGCRVGGVVRQYDQ